MNDKLEMLFKIFMVINDTEELLATNKLPEGVPEFRLTELNNMHMLDAYQRIRDIFAMNGYLNGGIDDTSRVHHILFDNSEKTIN